MIRKKIKKLIKISLKLLNLNDFKFFVERPKERIYGDYATNVAMLIANKNRKNPKELASLIISKLKELKLRSLLFEKIEVKEPGFINFFLSKRYLQESLNNILKQKEKFGNLKIGKNKKIQVEFISANPTGPLTVGNGRGGPVGSALANILEKAGFKTKRAYYINDFGKQILALGHSVLNDEKAEYKGEYIDYLRKRIKEKEPFRAGEEAAKIILNEMIKKTIERMGIRYDEWFSEKSLHKSKAVDRVINFLTKKGLTYKKDGALWFKSSKFKDTRDRVLIKQDGTKTYLASDISYHEYKFKKKKFNKVINVWGADHYGDTFGLRAGVRALGIRAKLDFLLLQFVTLWEKGKKVKMSKRRGVYLTMDELLDEIPVDVVKFFFLEKSADTHLNFDLNLAKDKSENNPVYYIQYAYARICAILRKCGRNFPKKFPAHNFLLLNHPEELSLIKELIRLPEMVEDISLNYQVHRLCQYAIELSTAFHRFYEKCQVISENKDLTTARLGLVLATKIVMKNVLGLMGISAPEKM